MLLSCFFYSLGNDHPTVGRANTAYFIKKAISYYHPERTDKYRIADRSGNPTTAGDVNQLIRYIKKHEVRGNGKQSQACTRLNLTEWENIISQIEDLNNVEKRLYLSALFRYQVWSFVAIQRNICLSVLFLF